MRYCLFVLILSASIFGAPPSPSTSGAVRVSVPDTTLVDQNGKQLRLYTDLVKGRKLVVINTIFTTCKTICPQIGFRIARLQKALAGVNAHDYSLISISVDPVVDTPERLRDWAARMGAKPGWTLLTGAKIDVDAVLQKLTLATPDKLTHSPIALVGGDDSKGFISVNALAPGDPLINIARQQLGSN